MRAFTTAVLTAFIAASAVVAQNPPQCLLDCSSSVPASCADLANDEVAARKCGCEDKAYIANSTSCLEVTCPTEEDFSTAQLIAVGLCAQLGVSISPEGKWIGPEAAASSSAAAASSSSASTTAPGSSSAPTPTETPSGSAKLAVPAVLALVGSALAALAL